VLSRGENHQWDRRHSMTGVSGDLSVVSPETVEGKEKGKCHRKKRTAAKNAGEETTGEVRA